MQVLFIDSVHPVLQEQLEAAGMVCYTGFGMSREELITAFPHTNGLVIRSRFRMDAATMDAFPHLKFIARSGSGMENIDVNHAEQRGIKLYNSPEGNCDAVGEHAVGMLLALLNHLCRGNREVRQGLWKREENRGLELAYRTVGIIGYGHTGSAFARKLSGFGCRILAYDKYKKGFGDDMVQECSMNELFREADVVSLHLPQHPETENLVNSEWIQQFRNAFFLINTSRGKVVNTEDLADALEAGKIKGACLDVLEYEKSSFESLAEEQLPEAFRRLSRNEQVLLSPHVAGWTVESYEKLSLFLARKILRDWKP